MMKSNISFKLTPAQSRYLAAAVKELHIKDLSAFSRGALLSAIDRGYRAQDPAWKKFVVKADKLAEDMLGYGIFDDGAAGTERYGSPAKGRPLSELIKEYEKKLAA